MYGYYLRAVIRTTIIFMVCTISASAQLKTCIVKEYPPERKRKQLYSDNPLRWLKGWKSIGDLLAGNLKHGFYSAFSHDEN